MEKQVSFGKYLTKLRQEKGISQRNLANLSGLTNSTISRIEAGLVKPDPATLNKIAITLDIDKSLLLTKCGYSDIPEDFLIIARKTGKLNEEQRSHIYNKFNETIDDFLEKLTEED